MRVRFRAIMPILNGPTGTREWGPSVCVYRPALARRTRVSSSPSSVQTRAERRVQVLHGQRDAAAEHVLQVGGPGQRHADFRGVGRQAGPLEEGDFSARFRSVTSRR